MNQRVALLVAALVGACGNDFAPENRIDGTRVIAARVHGDSDPTRASLTPGERGTVEYLLVGPPSGVVALRTSFVACVQASMAGTNGLAGCNGGTFGPDSRDVAAAFAPTLELPLSAPNEPSATLLTYLGTCAGEADVTLDPVAPSVRCADGGQGDLYELAFRMASNAQVANHHPNIHDQTYYLDDARWSEPSGDVPAMGCAALAASPSLPRVRSSRHDPPLVIFGYSPSDRETYAAFDADLQPITAREQIDISHYVTLGTIDAVTLGEDAAGVVASTPWTPPTSSDLNDAERAALPRGLLVRFWFIARDRRGGADWVERDLCLVP